jgi:hypothetical protein
MTICEGWFFLELMRPEVAKLFCFSSSGKTRVEFIEKAFAVVRL